MTLSKCYTPEDLGLSEPLGPMHIAPLAPELKIVDQHFTAAREQHPARRWEYAMALKAQAEWYDRSTVRPQGPVIDVGGAGSPFWKMVNKEVCQVVDPVEGMDLAEHLRLGARLASEVYCLSVIEHVDDLDQFLYHLGCLVAPGGLLFLTCDFLPLAGVADTAHFHWMRKRIFNKARLGAIAFGEDTDVGVSILSDFAVLGGTPDWRYVAPIEAGWGYTFASLALVKRA